MLESDVSVLPFRARNDLWSQNTFLFLRFMFEFEETIGKSLRNNQNPMVIFLNLLLGFLFPVSFP